MRRGFNHPFLPSFTPSTDQDRGQARWQLEVVTGLSVTETRRLWPLLRSSFLSQVTTDCDPVLTLKGAFGVRE